MPLGHWNMQPGIYKVEFYAQNVPGCGSMQLLRDNLVVTAWATSGVACAVPGASGSLAAAFNTVFGPNQFMGLVGSNLFISSSNPGTLIITKLLSQ
jgi:hypothetical protein